MDSNDLENYFTSHRHVLAVVFVIVAIMSVSGFFMGMRQSTNDGDWRSSWQNVPDVSAEELSEYPKVPEYGQIPEASWKANKDWSNVLSHLPQLAPDLGEQTPLGPAERMMVLKGRAERRAYDGAPPVIPHAINPRDVQSCTVCHGKDSNLVIAGRRPPVMSHPPLVNCIQCHTPMEGLAMLQHSGTVGLVVENQFTGQERVGGGTRAYPGAPPTVPHRIAMRQNCMACHGAGMPNAIVTSHPMRANCLQCHAQDAGYDNREMIAVPMSPWESRQ